MRKYNVFFVLTLLVFIAFSQSVYAEFVSSEIDIFVPDKMIVGEKYHGMITTLLPPSKDTMVEISTDNDFVIKVPQTTKISLNQNHGIFEILPIHEGEAEIFVSYNGEIVSSSTVVFSEKSGAQKLKVILPSNSTIASDVLGFVFLLDGNDSPVPANKDTIITLVSSEKITVPANVVIRNGTSNVSFPVIVRATGDITATAYGLTSGHSSITKSQNIIDVKMAIAPNIALPDSYVNYFIWLEKDGKPYSVPHILNVEIQSSNINSIRLGITPSFGNDILTISMMDGMATGRLYTGNDGVAEIFASITNYGHSSSLVYVGSVTLSDDGEIIQGEPIIPSEELNPNYIQFWVYPDITNDVAYGVASLYHSESEDTLEITIDDDGTQISNIVEYTTLTPIKITNDIISISSEAGLEYDSNYLIDGYHLPTQSKIFEIITQNEGDYIVTATGGNSYDTANLQVTTTHNSKFSILLTSLPIRTQSTQPLLFVSVVDENGSIIDIADSFGDSISLDIHTINGVVGKSSIKMYENVGIVSGFLTGIDTITISSNSFGSSEVKLIPSGVPVSVEFLIPDIVHVGEPFPITIHEIDSKGVPISKKDTNELSSTGFEKINEELITVSTAGESQIAILAQIGGAFQHVVNSFTNEISFSVSADKENVRVGIPIIIKVESTFDGIEYFIDSPFPSNKIDKNTFSVTPNYETENEIITITGKLDGFTPLNKKIEISSENIVELEISANDLNSKKLSPKYTIHLGGEIIQNITPNTHVINPQTVMIQFPNEYSTSITGYKLVSLEKDGEKINGNVMEFYAEKDHTIIVTYDRFVKITVNNGQGGGVYSYNEIVKISAPSKQKLSYLIMEKFDYWEGIDKPETFVIKTKNDFTITAMYREDYTGFMIVIILIVLGVMFVVYRKGDNKIRYYIIDFIDYLNSKIKIPVNNILKVSK